MKKFILVLTLLLSAGLASAAIESLEFKTIDQEEIYKDLIDELRCLVCQNQNLADSDAELAQDLRKQVYEMITEQGSDKKEIVDYMVARYGDFVLYRPPVKGNTLMLWLGPLVLLLLGLFVAVRVVRGTGENAAATAEKTDLAEIRKVLESQENDK